MPLTPFTAILGRKHAAHLLRRCTFGATKADIDKFASLTPQEALEILFKQTTEPAAPVDPLTAETWVDKLSTDANSNEFQLQLCFIRWWFGQTLATGVPDEDRTAFLTREKIVFLLHTHFTTIQETVDSSRSLYFQNVLFRKFSFDANAGDKINIKELAKKISLDNAMLLLLDGRLNIKGRPNENYAREFLELFTIGKGLPGSIPTTNTPGDYIYFTEQDVQAAAKVLSGYDFDDTFSNIDPDTELPRCKIKSDLAGNANQHDNSVKTFSFRLGNKEITPDTTLFENGKPTEASMHEELEQLVNLLFDQEETLRNICRRIYRFYVYHTIDTSIESNIISNMIVTFKSNNFKIEPVIRELVSSSHFYNNNTDSAMDDIYGGIIKSPLDLICGTLIFFEHRLPDTTYESVAFHKVSKGLVEFMEQQGMKFVNPFDVAGYDAYFQYPIYNRSWISANLLTQRYNFIYETFSTKMSEGDLTVKIDLLPFFKKNFAAVANDPDLLIKELASYLLPMSEEETELTKLRLNYFKTQFLRLGTGLPQGPLAFWQYSWTHTETNEASKDDARGMLQDLVNAMLQSPEYQLF